MELAERLESFKAYLKRDIQLTEDAAHAVTLQVHSHITQVLEEAKTAKWLATVDKDREEILGAIEGHMQLHPFVYVALAVIAGSALTIAAVFVAKF